MKNDVLAILTLFLTKFSVKLRACNDKKCFKIKPCLRKTATVLVLNTRLYEALSIFNFERTILIIRHCKLKVSDSFMTNFVCTLWSSTPGQFQYGRLIRAIARKIGDMIRDQLRILHLLLELNGIVFKRKTPRFETLFHY